MAKVTKYQFMEAGDIPIEYDSYGDLFFMVISGKVLCKVPFMKQLISLSAEEKTLFELEY